jgi:hypothetical protein
MIALKATLLSLREALEVTSVALDKALTAKAEEVETVEVVEVAQVEQVAEVAEEALKEALAVEKAVATPIAKAKKSRANKGKSTAHGAFTKFVMERYPIDSAEQKEFLERRIVDAAAGKIVYTADHSKVSRSGKRAVGDIMSVEEAKVGPHLAFVSEWKKEHQAEWLSFKAEWEKQHPKGSRASSVTGDTSDTGSAVEGSGSEAKEEKPKRGRKPMTQEQKDAAKAKREAKKLKEAVPEIGILPAQRA